VNTFFDNRPKLLISNPNADLKKINLKKKAGDLSAIVQLATNSPRKNNLELISAYNELEFVPKRKKALKRYAAEIQNSCRYLSEKLVLQRAGEKTFLFRLT